MTTRKTIAAAALFALNMAIACTITCAIITHVLAPFIDKSDDLLGGMWAVVATVFVFRDTRVHSFSAGVARLAATTLSIVLCLLYLLIFPFSGLDMAAVIGLGTFVIMLLGRPDDIITTGRRSSWWLRGSALKTRGINRYCGLRTPSSELRLVFPAGGLGLMPFSMLSERGSDDGLPSEPVSNRSEASLLGCFSGCRRVRTVG
jgi:hypothetical protein